MPRARAASSSTPEARVSRPMKMRPRPDQIVAARPRRSTSSGVRSWPTTPRTPSVPKYRRAKLALAELRRLARLVKTRLLPFDDAGVTGQEAGALQRHAQLGVRLDEGAGDPVANSPRLSARPTAVHTHADVVRPLDPCNLERR